MFLILITFAKSLSPYKVIFTASKDQSVGILEGPLFWLPQYVIGKLSKYNFWMLNHIELHWRNSLYLKKKKLLGFMMGSLNASQAFKIKFPLL